MKARLIRIGNSRGVRLAKTLLEEAGLTDDVDIRAQNGEVIITSSVAPRAGWAEAAALGMSSSISCAQWIGNDWRSVSAP